MADKQAQQLQQPEEPKKATPKLEARMFVMPQQYRHGAEGAMHQPETVKPPQQKIEVQTPAVPAPKAPPKPAVPPKKKKGSATKWILIIGLLFIVMLGVGGYLVVQSLAPTPEPDQEVEEPITRPEPIDEDPEEDIEPIDEDPEEDLEPVDPFGGEVTPGTDTDSDGLTDTEEEVVYGTDPRLPDSDADGFLDGNEVFHRYNPNGTAPGTLLGSGLVTMLVARAGEANFELNYPTIWDIELTDEELILDATTGEGFRLTYHQKEPRQPLDEWVELWLDLEDETSGVTKNGLVLIQTQDQLTNYIDLGYAVLEFTYDTGIKTRVDYLQTYQMMLNSIRILSESELEELEEGVGVVETPSTDLLGAMSDTEEADEEISEEVSTESAEDTEEESTEVEETEEVDEEL